MQLLANLVKFVTNTLLQTADKHAEPKSSYPKPQVMTAAIPEMDNKLGLLIKARDMKLKRLKLLKPRERNKTLKLICSVNKEIQEHEAKLSRTMHKNLWKYVEEAEKIGDSESFHRHLKKLKSTNDVQFPSMLQDEQGVEHREKNELPDFVADYFETVANHEDPEATVHSKLATPKQKEMRAKTKTLVASAIRKLEAIPPEGLVHKEINKDISRKEVTEAKKGKKQGTAPGSDLIQNGMIIHGGPALDDMLHEIFQLFWELGRVPSKLKTALIKLIFKKGDPHVIENWRPLSMLSSIIKIYEGILHARLKTLTTKHSLIRPEQNGYNPGVGSIDALMALTEILEYKRKKHEKFLLLSYDASKAFQRTDRDSLFATLGQKGVTGRMWKALRSLYESSPSQVRIGAERSRLFTLKGGTRQGSTLATFLFVTSVDDLLKELHESGAGIEIAGVFFPAICFVDDLLILTETVEQMQQMQMIVEDFAHKWKLVMNEQKQKITSSGLNKEIKIHLQASGMSHDQIQSLLVNEFKH
jgi:hypothetical protein